MKKKDFLALFDKYDDNAEIELWVEDGSLRGVDAVVFPSFNEQREAFAVYQEIISAIADGTPNKWVQICDAINLENLSYVRLVGKVKEIDREVRDNILYAKIQKEDIERNDAFYTTPFKDYYGEYFVCQHSEYEDGYYGQMLIDVGDGYLVVEYRE